MFLLYIRETNTAQLDAELAPALSKALAYFRVEPWMDTWFV